MYLLTINIIELEPIDKLGLLRARFYPAWATYGLEVAKI